MIHTQAIWPNTIFSFSYHAIFLTCNTIITFIFEKCPACMLLHPHFGKELQRNSLTCTNKSRIVCVNFHLISQNQRGLFEPQKSKLDLPKYNWSLNGRWLIAMFNVLFPCWRFYVTEDAFQLLFYSEVIEKNVNKVLGSHLVGGLCVVGSFLSIFFLS